MAKGLKTGGRKKGTTNKLSGSAKEMLNQFISMELEHLPAIIKNLEPKEKLDLLIRLLPYAIPKMAPVDLPIEKKMTDRPKMHQMFLRKPAIETQSTQE